MHGDNERRGLAPGDARGGAVRRAAPGPLRVGGRRRRRRQPRGCRGAAHASEDAGAPSLALDLGLRLHGKLSVPPKLLHHDIGGRQRRDQASRILGARPGPDKVVHGVATAQRQHFCEVRDLCVGRAGLTFAASGDPSEAPGSGGGSLPGRGPAAGPAAGSASSHRRHPHVGFAPRQQRGARGLVAEGRGQHRRLCRRRLGRLRRGALARPRSAARRLAPRACGLELRAHLPPHDGQIQHLVGRGPLLGRLFQKPHRQVPRILAVLLGRRDWCPGDDLQHQRRDVVGHKGLLQGQQLVKNNADGPDVRLAPVREVLANLGRQVVRSSDHRLGRAVGGLQDFGDAEVSQLDGPCRCQEDVLALDVSVQYSPRMHVRQGLDALRQHRERRPLLEGCSSILLPLGHDLGQISAVGKLHDDV
mmetsp:Transcript_85325/g.275354  ORF Transcript_85325/g.275354 Transcript_85325/m.275354 type:complete len:418 (-) Transcript_85325:326-1579(-)